MLDRVQNEISIQSALTHPHLLRLYCHLEDSEYFYLVLELCENGELFKFVRSNALCGNERAIRQFTRQIIDGVEYLHSQGVIHRDLKLSNIFINKDLRIKIGDFGLAKRLAKEGDPSHLHEEANTLCGTPNYISPEIISRKPYGFEADVWSFGVILYTLLVGNAPFETKELNETLRKIMTTKLELPATLSEQSKSLLSALLNPNPNARLDIQSIKRHPFYANDSSPLTSFSLERLKPTKQSLSNGTIEITSEGQVVLEYADENYMFVTNGTEILLKHKYQPGCIRAYSLATYPTLPTELQKKYRLVCKFVDLVRSKTLKIGFSLPGRRKAYLMENGDFYYYSGGRKLRYTPRERVVELMERERKQVIFTECNVDSMSSIASIDSELEGEATKMYKEMVELEKSKFVQFPYISKGNGPLESDAKFSITQNFADKRTFPMANGFSHYNQTTANSIKQLPTSNYLNNYMTRTTNYAPILIGNTKSVPTQTNENVCNYQSGIQNHKPNISLKAVQTNAVYKETLQVPKQHANNCNALSTESWAFLHDVGWGSKVTGFKNKFMFLFNDGTQMVVDAEHNTLQHKYRCTDTFIEYPINCFLPSHIKSNLGHLETFLRLLLSPIK